MGIDDKIKKEQSTRFVLEPGVTYQLRFHRSRDSLISRHRNTVSLFFLF